MSGAKPEVLVDQESIRILGEFYRECVGASDSKELKRIVCQLSNMELGTLGVFIDLVHTISQTDITFRNTDQLSLPLN